MSKNSVNIAGRSVFLVAVVFSVWCGQYGKAEIYPSIFWTPHNPIFSTVKPSNELKVFPYSRLHIVCPKAWTILTTLKAQVSKNELYQNIWRVDAASYQTCSAAAVAAQPALLYCKSPQPQTIEFVTFEFKSPAVSETTFPPGKEYFFIATSNGTRSSLNSTSGGYCFTHNMRFKVYVCRDSQDVRCSTTTKSTTGKPKTTESAESEDEIVSGGVSNSESFDKRNGTDVTLKLCNNTAFGTKSETEPSQKTKIFVCSVAILASVAALSIALNAILLWQLKCKKV